MADDNGGGSNAAVVAIFVIFLIIVAAAIFFFGGQFVGGGSQTKKVDVNVNAPAVPSKSPSGTTKKSRNLGFLISFRNPTPSTETIFLSGFSPCLRPLTLH